MEVTALCLHSSVVSSVYLQEEPNSRGNVLIQVQVQLLLCDNSVHSCEEAGRKQQECWGRLEGVTDLAPAPDNSSTAYRSVL